MSKIVVIGAGFSGISAAAYLAKKGHEVLVFEKNNQPGGRARQLKTPEGYLFDMGPSWYWMPGVFENFFRDFSCKVADFYTLDLLDPSFDVFFPGKEKMSIPAGFESLCDLFESIEPGAAGRLRKFMDEASFKYKAGMENLVYKPGISISELMDKDLMSGLVRLQVFSSFSRHVKKYFKDPRLRSVMEFPVLFLGAMPEETPALYSLMNYAGLKLGTWYPQGGFGKVVEAMVQVAEAEGARFSYNAPVEKILNNGRKVNAVLVDGERISCDAIISAADYHHAEKDLLETEYRNYPEDYWDKRTFAPSCLIYYLGVNKKLDQLKHHTLFFDEDLAAHSQEIFKSPAWPKKPLFYVCCPSRTDETVAPEGHENLFLLMPLAPGLQDDEPTRERYFSIMMRRLEENTGESIEPFIDYKKGYCVSDFIADYNAYKGNAYGLANTLRQTAHLKPKIFNRKLKNLFYTGQLTVPGPGVPPAIISGKVVATELMKSLKKSIHEVNL